MILLKKTFLMIHFLEFAFNKQNVFINKMCKTFCWIVLKGCLQIHNLCKLKLWPLEEKQGIFLKKTIKVL